MSRTPLPTLKAPRDQDRTDRAPFEVLPGEADHPELAAWGENVGAPLSLDLAAPLARGTTEIDLLSWNLAIGTARLGEVLERIGPRERPLVILAQEAFRTDASVPEHPGSGFHGGLLAMPGERRSIEQVAREHGLS
ncbi:MAG: hypothetical protein M3409_10855, partial [Gemmatimonadota bacterium]|nr:hypothetical protein [Gemmatimonadota bacterium]